MKVLENRLKLEDKDRINPYLTSRDYDRVSFFSFPSLYMWREEYDISWEIHGKYLLVATANFMEDGQPPIFLLPPFSRDGEYDPESLREAVEYSRTRFLDKGLKMQLRLVPETMQQALQAAFPHTFEKLQDRDNYDYIYQKEDLVNLTGRKYHSKKNHLNYFKNTYDYTYEKLTSGHKAEVLKFVEEYRKTKTMDPLEWQWLDMETRAIGDMMEHMEDLGLVGGAIRIDGEMVAFTIASQCCSDTYDINVEKAKAKIRGSYAAINNEFCSRLDENIVFVNREEDMGIENLRKSKLSYRPLELIEKSIVNV